MQKHQFNAIIGYFYHVNFIMGTGFLGIPFSFYYAGVVPGVITLTLLSITGCITSLWMLESMARTNALIENCEEVDQQENIHGINYEISEIRKFELAEIGEILFGLPGKIFNFTVVTIFILITLWSYAAVAATAWSINIPIHTSVLAECSQTDYTLTYFPKDVLCFNLYRVCLLVFGVIVMLLSLMELEEQKYIQILFGILRYTAIFSITIFSTYIIVYNIYNPINPIPTELNNTHSNAVDLLLRCDMRQWLATLPIVAFALNLIHGISPLSYPVSPKKHLKPMLISVFTTLWCVYGLIGIIVSMAFLYLINENAVLNWSYFANFPNSIPIRLISNFLMLFPSLDIISIYSLYVTLVANNIYLIVMRRDTSQGNFRSADRIMRLFLRLIVAGIPLIGAIFVTNLVRLVKIAGIFAFTIQFMIPIASQYQSIRLCRKKIEIIRNIKLTTTTQDLKERNAEIRKKFNIKEFLFKIERNTVYSGWYSNNITVIVVGVLGVFCFCLACVSIIN